MRVVPNEHVVSRRVGDRMVLIHLTTNQIYELNETSARLWELLTEHSDVLVAQQRLMEEFDVDQDRLATEVESIVSAFASARLLTRHDAG